MTVVDIAGKWISAPDQDRNFVTFVDPDAVLAPVPEVSTWTLLVGGFGMIGAAVRRRAKALARLA